MQAIEELVRSSENAGRHCAFFIDDNGRGIKAYLSESMRNRCYAWQHRLSKVGFAPKVYEKFSVGKFFCYVTEIAETSWEMANEYEERERVKDKIHKAVGKWFKDDCWFNFGLLNGKVVVIDCDPYEFYGFPEACYKRWREKMAQEVCDMEGYLKDAQPNLVS